MVLVFEYLLNNCTEATFREFKSTVGTTPIARELSNYAWILVEKIRGLKAKSRPLFTLPCGTHIVICFLMLLKK